MVCFSLAHDKQPSHEQRQSPSLSPSCFLAMAILGVVGGATLLVATALHCTSHTQPQQLSEWSQSLQVLYQLPRPLSHWQPPWWGHITKSPTTHPLCPICLGPPGWRPPTIHHITSKLAPTRLIGMHCFR